MLSPRFLMPSVVREFIVMGEKLREANIHPSKLRPLTVTPEECDAMLRYLQPWHVDYDSSQGTGSFANIKWVVVDPNEPKYREAFEEIKHDVDDLHQHYRERLGILEMQLRVWQERHAHVLRIASRVYALIPRCIFKSDDNGN